MTDTNEIEEACRKAREYIKESEGRYKHFNDLWFFFRTDLGLDNLTAYDAVDNMNNYGVHMVGMMFYAISTEEEFH